MIKKKQLKEIKFIEIADLTNGRFSFVKSSILRENIAIKMQHIIFLLSLEEEYELPGSITYSAFKTIIIYTASIVESLIHYKIEELVKSKKITHKNFMGTEDVYSDCKVLYKVSDYETICGVKKNKKEKKLKKDTNFLQLSRAAKRIGLFDQILFDAAEDIRKTRNRIHPYSLKEVDDKYTKEEINKIFAMTNKIIARIETYTLS